jgi:hypothetical protein
MGLPILGAFYSIQYNQRVCNIHIIFIVNKQLSESVSDIGKCKLLIWVQNDGYKLHQK